METEEKEFHLKNGRVLIIRSPRPEDAQSMLRYLKTVAGETHYMIRYPEEVTPGVEEEKKFLQNILDSERDFMIAAFDGDTVAGNVSAACMSSSYKMRHRGDLGIAVCRDYWSQGLGRFLAKEALAVAEEAAYEQIELGVFADNTRALKLYESLGFLQYGRCPDAFRLKEGGTVDEVLMYRKL